MTPHPGPRRPQVAVRISEAGIAEVDHLADLAGVKRSEMLRRLLAAAVADSGIRKRVTTGKDSADPAGLAIQSLTIAEQLRRADVHGGQRHD